MREKVGVEEGKYSEESPRFILGDDIVAWKRRKKEEK